MARRTKDEIAEELYGTEYDLLSAGEKARVSRVFNAQRVSTSSRTRANRIERRDNGDVIKAEIGRVSANGVKICYMKRGDTIADLLRQAGLVLNDNERILFKGFQVALSDEVEEGSYVISFSTKSA